MRLLSRGRRFGRRDSDGGRRFKIIKISLPNEITPLQNALFASAHFVLSVQGAAGRGFRAVLLPVGVTVVTRTATTGARAWAKQFELDFFRLRVSRSLRGSH